MDRASIQPSPVVECASYTEFHLSSRRVRSRGLPRCIPVFEGLYEGGCGLADEVQEKVKELQSSGTRVSLLPISYKGQTAESISHQLQHFVGHYRMQLLLVRERTARELLVSEECSSRTNYVVALRYSTPLKHKILTKWSENKLKELVHEDWVNQSVLTPRRPRTHPDVRGESPDPRGEEKCTKEEFMELLNNVLP